MSENCVHEWYYRIVDIVSWQFFCIRCGEKLSMDKFSDRATELEKNADALNTRIAELEERLESCESALASMVYQFFYPSESGALVHSFMSAEEEAAEYLVDYGIARWENEHKNSIVFEEVQE